MIDMTNKLLEEFTGNLFPRGMGTPYRCNNFKEYYIANSVTEIESFITQNNETDCYITAYPFKEYTQENRDKYSAIINVLVFDLDDADNPENAIADAKILIKWCDRHNIKYRIQYTGFKGVHIFINITPIKLIHPQETLRKFFMELNKSANLKTLDFSIVGDLDRLIRLPNTINSKTNRYCIPINPKIFTFLSIRDLEKAAVKKSNYIPILYENDGDICTLLKEYDSIVGTELEEAKIKIKELEEIERKSLFPGLTVGVICMAYITCIDIGVKTGNRNQAAAGIVQKCKKDGLTFNKTFDILLQFGEKCQPKLTESELKKILNYHWKSDYSICTFFSKFCSKCIICPNKTF